MARARTPQTRRWAASAVALHAALLLVLACASVFGLSVKPLALLQQRVGLSDAHRDDPGTVCPQDAKLLSQRVQMIGEPIPCTTFTDFDGAKWEVRGYKAGTLPTADKLAFTGEDSEGWVEEASPVECMDKCSDISAGKTVPGFTGQTKKCSCILFSMKDHMRCQYYSTQITQPDTYGLKTHLEIDIAYLTSAPAGADGAGGGGPIFSVSRDGGDLDITTTVNLKF